MTKRKVEQPLVIEDGTHKGTITRLDIKTEPYEYIDVWIEESEKKMQLKAGYPDKLTPLTVLGKLLSRFLGKEVVPEDELDLDKILIGRECVFMTMEKEKDGQKFCSIIRESVKPVVKEEKVE